jgi:hypothetical protein
MTARNNAAKIARNAGATAIRTDFVAVNYWVRNALLYCAQAPQNEEEVIQWGLFEDYVYQSFSAYSWIGEFIDVVRLRRMAGFADNIDPRQAFEKLFTSVKRHNPTKVEIRWKAGQAYSRCFAAYAKGRYRLEPGMKRPNRDEIEAARGKFLVIPATLLPPSWVGRALAGGEA